MQLHLHQFDLPLKHPFTISRGTITVKPTLIVELVEYGRHGYGETTASSYYGATIEGMTDALERVRPQVEAATLADPAELWEVIAPYFVAGVSDPGLAGSATGLTEAGYNFALCALDQAAHDLWGKKLGAPVWKLWGLSIDNLPPSDFTIGIDTLDRMVAKLQEMPGWPIYKIKLGTPPVAGLCEAGAATHAPGSQTPATINDLAIVRELRRHTDAVFRVDANGGWTVDETLRNARELAALGVEFVEQPLPAGDWAGARRVFEQSVLPIMADESCVGEADVDRCHGHFHGIDIKLVKCGGLTPARRMIARARALGLKVMLGCMTESTVGISAAAQLVPLVDHVDLDGAVLLSRDIATGVHVARGRFLWPAENGTGVRLVRAAT